MSDSDDAKAILPVVEHARLKRIEAWAERARLYLDAVAGLTGCPWCTKVGGRHDPGCALAAVLRDAPT